MAMKGNKEMMTISLSPDTKDRLKKYAEESRKSVSQAITDWISDGNGDNTGVEEK